jgi:HAD superfamily hydrolase (TIGR01509 family)
MTCVSDLPSGSRTAPTAHDAGPGSDDAEPGSDDAEPPGAATPGLVGLVVDWGGVLTGSLDAAMSRWARTDGVDFQAFRDVMRQWVGRRGEDVAAVSGPGAAPSGVSVFELEQAPDSGPAGDSPVHLLERGQMTTEDFERELSAQLTARGWPVPPEGLLARLLAGLADLDPRMLGLLRRSRAAGLRTALLSNSWGDHYPEQLWQGIFDAVVISGRVGMRKPEPEIFRYTAERLGLPTTACVMVDDLPHNVSGAVAVGMVGVLHRGPVRRPAALTRAALTRAAGLQPRTVSADQNDEVRPGTSGVRGGRIASTASAAAHGLPTRKENRRCRTGSRRWTPPSSTWSSPRRPCTSAR